MKSFKLSRLAVAAVLALGLTVRAKTADISYGYRMGAGFPGDVNRAGMLDIVPSLQDTTNPVLLYGNPVIMNPAANSVRNYLTTDAPLVAPVQAAASTSTTGGTGLVAATAYYYKVTAINALGETIASNEQTVTTGAGGTNSNTVNWGAVTGATGYRVYRGTAAGAENTYFQVGAVTTLVDTGALTAGGLGVAPPTVNTTLVARLDGILVRPFPLQQASGGMTSTIGAAVPPVGPAVVDVLRAGFAIVKVNNFAVTPSTKGGAVYIWVAASSGNHVLGGLEAAYTAGSTIQVSNARFASPPDSTGVAEVEVWAA